MLLNYSTNKIFIMKNIEYKIHINAPKQKVWETMIKPDTYKKWVAVGWPNSFYEGEWGKSEKIKFVSKDGSGTLALIEVFKPYEYFCETHRCIIARRKRRL